MNIQEFSVRRGLVLGFTAAEIVVLLLFLLLLIMGILYHTSGESEDKTIAESTLGDDEQYLDDIPPYEVLIAQYSKIVRELEVDRAQIADQEIKIGEIESDVEVKQERIDVLATNLEEAVARNERYQALIKDQQNETHALRSEVEDLNQEIDETESRSDLYQKEIEQLTTKSDELEKQFEPLQQLNDENARLKQLSKTMEQKLLDLESQNQAAASSNQDLEYELERAQAVIERLHHELTSLEDKVVFQSDENERTKRKNLASEYLVEQLEEKLNNEKRNNERLQDLIDRLDAEKNNEIEKIRNLQIGESNEFADIQQRNNELEVAFAQAQEIIAQLKSRNSRLSESESKGTNSACWYRMKPNEDGSKEERALYIFDIRILDDSILVYYPSKSRNGFSEDANFSRNQLVEIFDEIGFDQSVIGKPLRFSEFGDAFKGFKTAGRNMKIREGQQCTFNVALWDHTSLTNKEGYQKAKEQVVDQIFSSYRYRDDPWPHG